MMKNIRELNKIRSDCAYQTRIENYSYEKFGPSELYYSWCKYQYKLDLASLYSAKNEQYNYEQWEQMYYQIKKH